MGRTYNVIDADGHVIEPPDFWTAYMDPAYRDRAPQLFVDTDGKERLRVEGKVLGGPTGLGAVGAIGARQGAASINGVVADFPLCSWSLRWVHAKTSVCCSLSHP